MNLHAPDGSSGRGAIDALTFINPPGVVDPAPNGYSHLAVFPAGWRVLLPAGQGGETADGRLSPDFGDQVRQAFANREIVLRAGGATMTDVAKATMLVVDHDMDKLAIIGAEVGRIWGARPPAMTLIPVPTLALPGMLFEFDAIAVVPA